MQDFRRLKVWEKSHRLVLDVYMATGRFPSEERYGLTSQVRRSAASIPTNIAEGCGRHGCGDFLRFLDIAMGSARETEYQLLLASDLGYLAPTDYSHLEQQATEIKRMLGTLINKLRSDN